MCQKMFYQIVFLIVLSAIAFYIVFPRYEFFRINFEPTAQGERITTTTFFRCNKIMGTIEWKEYTTSWEKLGH